VFYTTTILAKWVVSSKRTTTLATSTFGSNGVAINIKVFALLPSHIFNNEAIDGCH